MRRHSWHARDGSAWERAIPALCTRRPTFAAWRAWRTLRVVIAVCPPVKRERGVRCAQLKFSPHLRGLR